MAQAQPDYMTARRPGQNARFRSVISVSGVCDGSGMAVGTRSLFESGDGLDAVVDAKRAIARAEAVQFDALLEHLEASDDACSAGAGSVFGERAWASNAAERIVIAAKWSSVPTTRAYRHCRDSCRTLRRSAWTND